MENEKGKPTTERKRKKEKRRTKKETDEHERLIQSKTSIEQKGRKVSGNLAPSVDANSRRTFSIRLFWHIPGDIIYIFCVTWIFPFLRVGISLHHAYVYIYMFVSLVYV